MSKIIPSYIAGLIDSDGTLVISKRVRCGNQPIYSARFTIHWKKHPYALEIFEELKSMYGGNIGFVKHKNCEMYTYSLSDKRMDKFLEEVGSCVVLKRNQVEVLLNLRKTVKRRAGLRKSDSLVETQESFYQKIKELNGGIIPEDK